jgi:hypothetical protein
MGNPTPTTAIKTLVQAVDMQAPLPLCSLNVTLHAAGAGMAKREHCAAPPNHLGAKKLQLKIKLKLSADVQAPLPLCSLNVMLYAAGAGSMAKREYYAAPPNHLGAKKTATKNKT